MYINGIGEVTQGYNDIHVIPDRHNTGCDMETCTNPPPITGVGLDNGLFFRADNDEQCYIDFNKRPTITGEFIFENVDFSSKTGWVGYGNTDKYVGEGIKLIFNNCKFYGFYSNKDNVLVQCEFNNCSFRTTALANAVYNNCFLGGESDFDIISSADICAPKDNVTFNNCYFADIVAKTEEQGDAHLDGMQTICGKNMYFNNCRWEVPDINYTYKQGNFSYAVFVQNNNIENVIFDHCYINGGGHYSISITDAEPVNCRIIEPFIGYCYYGGDPFYPSSGGNYTNSAKAVTEKPRLHDSLYVSSVWKEDNKLHFLVTNDTGEDRTLSVHTNNGVTTFEVPRTYRLTEYEADTKDFGDFPIDIEHIVEADVSYAVFMENNNQIRFVDFGGEEKTYETVNDLFKDICDAIREKTQTSEPIKHTDIPEKIRLL